MVSRVDFLNRLKSAYLASLPEYDRPADYELMLLEVGSRATKETQR